MKTKTQIVTKQELDQLSESARTELFSILEKRETAISSLKTRVAKLPYQRISYRSDINEVGSTKTDDFLTFRVWEKTAGEQWGNNCGNEYIMKFGTKYIRFEKSFWNSERNIDHSTGSTYISNSVAEEIVDLAEKAFESDNDIDRDRLLSIAALRIEKLSRVRDF
jgi:hypothetical protein